MKARLIRAAPEWLSSNGSASNGNGNRKREEQRTTPRIQQPSPQPPPRIQQRPEGADLPASQTHRIALAVLACLQNSLVGGLVYGWASLNSTLLTTEPFPRGGCGLTLADTTVIFAMASCTGMASTLLLGFCLDRFGPRVCSVTSHVAIAAGCQLFAASTAFTGFALATCLIAFGGPGIQVSIVHLANLFPKNQFTALAMLNGTISISMSVFAVFSWLWERYDWITYRILFGYFNIPVLLSLGASLVVWPDYSFKPPPASLAQRHDAAHHTVEDDYIEAATVHQRWMTEQPLNSYLRRQLPQQQQQQSPGTTTASGTRGNSNSSRLPIERHDSFILSQKAIESGVWNMVSLKDAPFRRQFLSGYYVRGNLFFIVVCLLANFRVASITTELADANDFSVRQQNQLTQLFTIIMSGGFVASFVIGLIMDHAGVEAATGWTIALALLHELILLCRSDRPTWLTVAFVIYVFFRQFLFPVSIALITARLGFKYFGLLNGMAFLLSGVVQLFMVPVVNLVKGTCHQYNSSDAPLILDTCDHGQWPQLHAAAFVVLALLLLVPWYDRRAQAAQAQRVKKVVQMRASWQVLYGGASPLLGRSLSSSSSKNGSYGSMAAAAGGGGGVMPSVHSSGSIRMGRDPSELEVLDETDDEEEGLEF